MLPGFFMRFGSRLTRVSAFHERWLPTSHFLNLTMLRAAFDVIELDEWKQYVGGRPRLPKLMTRAIENREPQMKFFEHHNISFRVAEATSTRLKPSTPSLARCCLGSQSDSAFYHLCGGMSGLPTSDANPSMCQATVFPHFIQQQTELRWVTDDARRQGYFSRYHAQCPAQCTLIASSDPAHSHRSGVAMHAFTLVGLPCLPCLHSYDESYASRFWRQFTASKFTASTGELASQGPCPPRR